MTKEYLHECFDYNPDSGMLTWKADRPLSHFKNESCRKNWRSQVASKVAGTVTGRGCLVVSVGGKSFDVHRIAWIMTHGELHPKVRIKHISGDRADNRIVNLRLDTSSQNLCKSTDDKSAPFNLPERLWDKIMPEPNTGCWLWIGADYGNGYGACHMKGKPTGRTVTGAHRVVYTEVIGVIPHGLSLDHLCRMPGCVNPAHLEPVTHQENILRGISPMARQAKQTHCLKGHELVGDNLYLEQMRSGKTKRHCRTCMNRRNLLAYYKKKKNGEPITVKSWKPR